MELTATKYKQTEVGLIPEDWEVRTLGEIAKVIGGGTPKTNVLQYWNGNISWFTPTEVGERKYLYDSKRKISLEGLQNSSAQILPIGTILFTSRAGIGDLGILTKEAATNQGFQSLLVYQDYYNEYIYYLLSTLKSKFLSKASGSTFLEISPSKVKEVNAAVPPTLTEQKTIARVLSDTDALIQALEKKIAKKKLIKKGAMQELLKPKEGWKKVKLEHVIEVGRGGSPRPIQDFITDSPNGINWIKIGDTSSKSKYIVSSKEKIISEGIKNSREVKVGDFLLSNSMSFGRPYILKIDGCIHDGWLVLQNYKQHFDTEFLYYTLTSEDVLNQYLSKASGSGVLNLNKALVNTVILKKPVSLLEQKQIAKVLSTMDNEIEQLEQKLGKYKKVKQGMMQQLLTGKIRLV